MVALRPVQVVAYTYYMLSYIPFGRTLLTKCLTRVKDWCIRIATS